ncbi:hypothetical protein RFZ45_10505, partial [Acinetobacter baumannii]|nr:hypothetical protein [Acinetobacter baumannii]
PSAFFSFTAVSTTDSSDFASLPSLCQVREKMFRLPSPQEVKYIEKALEISEKDYLSDLDEFIGGNRQLSVLHNIYLHPVHVPGYCGSYTLF